MNRDFEMVLLLILSYAEKDYDPFGDAVDVEGLMSAGYNYVAFDISGALLAASNS
jgi:hypothetical protein